MAIQTKKNIKKKANRNFLAKDFDAFRSELLRNARIFFPDKISDFSEPSVGGLFLDMAATVGDSLSFYLDHSFRELDPLRAVEPDNILTHMRNAGLQPIGASPASVILDVIITVKAELVNNVYVPKLSSLPIILEGTSFNSEGGVNFIITEDLDFSKKDPMGNFVAKHSIRSSQNGIPQDFNVTMSVLAVSGDETTEDFVFDAHVPFATRTLSNSNVSTILSVVDSENNEYYQVESLTQDNVFSAVENRSADFDLVSHNLEIMPAPRRFVVNVSTSTRSTTLRFGSGDAEIFDDDILPDPSDLSLELFGRKTFSRFSIDPNSLLKTQTLGISPSNTTLTVKYRHGGGIGHNVSSNTINDLNTLRIEFRNKPDPEEALDVRNSVRSNNKNAALGGAEAPNVESMRDLITTGRNSQMRIVSRQDLLARIHTLPSKFGRVFRAAIEPNPENHLSSILYICSLDADSKISLSPDSLKKNLSTYLNEYRLISDAVDILDARVYNFAIEYEIVIKNGVDRTQVLNIANSEIAEALDRKYFQIGQPLIEDDIVNVLLNVKDVISIKEITFSSRSGNFENREYSPTVWNKQPVTRIHSATSGAIFELRYPEFDIVGAAS